MSAYRRRRRRIGETENENIVIGEAGGGEMASLAVSRRLSENNGYSAAAWRESESRK